jgi:hypothetical protein
MHFGGRWNSDDENQAAVQSQNRMAGVGPERHLLRDSNTSEIGGKAEKAGVRSKRG